MPKNKLMPFSKALVSFPRWREVLPAEYTDPAKARQLEQDIFGYLKYLNPG